MRVDIDKLDLHTDKKLELIREIDSSTGVLSGSWYGWHIPLLVSDVPNNHLTSKTLFITGKE